MRLRIGSAIHALSDWLHLLAHRMIDDSDWRARNGLDLDEDEALELLVAVGKRLRTLGPGNPGFLALIRMRDELRKLVRVD